MNAVIVALLVVLVCARGLPAPLDRSVPSDAVDRADSPMPAKTGVWENPFVLVTPEGVLLNEGGGTDAPAVRIALTELAGRLRALPASAWKDGKRVGLQSQSIVSSADDAAKIARNVKAAEAILKNEGFEVVPFPSG